MNTTTKILGSIALTAAAAFAAFKLLGKKEAPAPPPQAPVPPAPPKAHKPKAPKIDPFMKRSEAIGVILYGINAVQKIENKHAAASLGGKFAVAVNSMSDSELEGYAKHWQALAKNIEAGNGLNPSPILSKEAKDGALKMVNQIKNAVPEKPESPDLKAAASLYFAMDGPGTNEARVFDALKEMQSWAGTQKYYRLFYKKELSANLAAELNSEGMAFAKDLIKKKP